jgi:plastocyanin
VQTIKSLAIIGLFLAGSIAWSQAPKTVEVIAGSDNTFKVTAQKKPVITVKPGQVLKLHVIAKKGQEWAKDGSVHSLTINSLKDQGWDLPVKEGNNDFTVVAPSTPGEYTIECAIKCGQGHEDMKMKLVVTP